MNSKKLLDCKEINYADTSVFKKCVECKIFTDTIYIKEKGKWINLCQNCYNKRLLQ